MTAEGTIYTVVLRDGVVVYRTSDDADEVKIEQIIDEDRHAATALNIKGNLAYTTERVGVSEAVEKGYIARLDII